MQSDSAQSSDNPPVDKQARKWEGRTRDRDKGRTQDVTTINFHDQKPVHPFLKELALQLERIEDGVKTAIVFSYATDIPTTYDPDHPPPELGGNERHSELLRSFYNLRTSRKCPMNCSDPSSHRHRRCPVVNHGFAEIICHQSREHSRPCFYLCLIPDCLAVFDKVCNAKRHVEKKHPAHCYENIKDETTSRQRRQTEGAAKMKEILESEEIERSELRKIRHGHVAKRIAQRMNEKTRASHTKRRERDVINPRNNAEETTRKMFAQRKANLEARSEITVLDSGNILITVTPKNESWADIEAFHSQLVRNGFKRVVPKNDDVREWVATTALLKIAYHPKKIHYNFTKHKRRRGLRVGEHP